MAPRPLRDVLVRGLGEFDELDGDVHLIAREAKGRIVLQVGGLVFLNQLPHARRIANCRVKRGTGLLDPQALPTGCPDRTPERGQVARFRVDERTLGGNDQHERVGGRVVRPRGIVQGAVVRLEPCRAARAVAGYQGAPGSALLRFDAPRLPHVPPVALRAHDFGFRGQGLERIDQTVIGIDPHPELRLYSAVTAHGTEARLEAQREQEERCGIIQQRGGFAGVGECLEVATPIGERRHSLGRAPSRRPELLFVRGLRATSPLHALQGFACREQRHAGLVRAARGFCHGGLGGYEAAALVGARNPGHVPSGFNISAP